MSLDPYHFSFFLSSPGVRHEPLDCWGLAGCLPSKLIDALSGYPSYQYGYYTLSLHRLHRLHAMSDNMCFKFQHLKASSDYWQLKTYRIWQSSSPKEYNKIHISAHKHGNHPLLGQSEALSTPIRKLEVVIVPDWKWRNPRKPHPQWPTKVSRALGLPPLDPSIHYCIPISANIISNRTYCSPIQYFMYFLLLLLW